MAFLDNSGDIILDAVLTDTGRFRLAKGDGSFKIVKFALADDEINYGLYDKNNTSGSAYYDLDILQTPVMEAFTNNTSTMNYKLLSIPRTNLLYLPVLKINSRVSDTSGDCSVNSQNDGYAVCVTQDTYDALDTKPNPGTLNGESPNGAANQVRLDQGIDNDGISWRFELDQDLRETQYIIEVDSRLANVANPDNETLAQISFIDDDNIASYYLSDGTEPDFVKSIRTTPSYTVGVANNPNVRPADLVIAGPQGTTVNFKLKSTLELMTSNYLFDTIGAILDSTQAALWGFDITAKTYKYIDTVVKVTGATTGYRLDLPVRFIKRTS